MPVVHLDPDLPLPSYARAGDAGLDLVAREGAVLAPGGRPGTRAHRRGLRPPPRVRRVRPAPQWAGAAPRGDRDEQPGPHRLRVPRRAQGAAREPRPQRNPSRCTAAIGSPSSSCRPWPRWRGHPWTSCRPRSGAAAGSGTPVADRTPVTRRVSRRPPPCRRAGRGSSGGGDDRRRSTPRRPARRRAPAAPRWARAGSRGAVAAGRTGTRR